MNARSSHSLMPLPKGVRLGAERVVLDFGPSARIEAGDARVAAEWERLKLQIGRCEPSGSASRAQVTVIESPAQVGHPEGYQLRIRQQRTELIGGSAAGCFFGLKTLGQLIDPESGELPCGEIHDEPVFCTRGLLHDVTRGKSPKLETLKLLADRLADWRINQLQLYIEHAFVFPSDPEICGSDEGLTPDDIRELDRYCRGRFIDLVPAVATLGHMGRILSMPRYRHLAEVEAVKPWEQMTWLERMRGFTLDVLNPESRELVSRIWTDILDAFSSPVVNICGDEPWDLGRGKNAGRLNDGAPSPGGQVRSPAFPSRDREGAVTSRGEAYVDHIRWTHDFCVARSRRTQLWGDVVRNYPDLLHKLPSDLTVLHWGYDDKADYEGTRVFTDAGLETIVCPGTSGWKRIINAMDLAERNIAAFAKAGKRHGATGLINTDWGDFGHFNPLACSWHGIALGAVSAWSVDEIGGADFDGRFAARVLNAPAELVSALRTASAIAERFETWRLFALPDNALLQEKTLPSAVDCERAAAAASTACRAIGRLAPTDPAIAQDYRELAVACRFTELLAGRVAALRDSGQGKGVSPAWSVAARDALAEYADCWNARNKPSRLLDVVGRVEGMMA